MRFSPDKRATDVLIGAGAPDAIALVLLALGECLLVASEDEAVAATTAAVVAVIASS